MDITIKLSKLKWGLSMYETNINLLKNTKIGILNYKTLTDNEIINLMSKLKYVISYLNIYSKKQYLHDLQLINKFNKLLDDKPDYYNFNSKFSQKTHKDFFILEDESMFWPRDLITYLNNKLNKNISVNTVEDILFSYTQVIYYVKDKFNRPRPYQIAKILNKKINVLPAETSLTASCPSGHAFQGYLLGTIIYLLYPELSDSNNKKLLDLILAISVDIGIRRVMAGVHFFSDNIVSYYMLKTLLKTERIYNKAQPFLDAILKKINILL